MLRNVRIYFECTVAFEVLSAVIMESRIFWDETPCSSVEVHHENSICLPPAFYWLLYTHPDQP
jgi:hypothetical protein